LRAKLGAEYEVMIGTVRNVGYRFVPDTTQASTLATLHDEVAIDAEV
jgi:DNA-binding winged helix-turn-helix (wHTH) protein